MLNMIQQQAQIELQMNTKVVCCLIMNHNESHQVYIITFSLAVYMHVKVLQHILLAAFFAVFIGLSVFRLRSSVWFCFHTMLGRSNSNGLCFIRSFHHILCWLKPIARQQTTNDIGDDMFAQNCLRLQPNRTTRVNRQNKERNNNKASKKCATLIQIHSMICCMFW